MATKIITNISTTQLNQTIDELHQYAQRLADRCELFVNELADIGIQTAKYYLTSIVNDTSGEMISYGDKVFFSKDVTFDTESATCIIIPESMPYISAWQTGIALVDPLLMAEFGSGMFVFNHHAIPRDLCHDACRSNGCTLCVALDDLYLWETDARNDHGIIQKELGFGIQL